MKKFGFTLTELLIALGVIGVLAAVLMPVVHNIIPNQNVMMAKRAYYTLQTAVSDLINDPACYPDKTQAPGSERREGFDDGYGYENCIWGNNTIPNTSQYIETEGNAGEKFRTLMLEKMNSLDENVIIPGYTWYTAKDGISYAFSNGDLKPNEVNGSIFAFIDVNGINNGNDCTKTSVTAFIPVCTNKDPDTFSLNIFRGGQIKIYPDDTWTIEAVKANANITGK